MTDVAPSLVEEIWGANFKSDRATSRRLTEITGQLGFPAENIAARWALVRSLREGKYSDLPEFDDHDGKELKGKTLFGGKESAALLVGQILLVEGTERASAELRDLTLAHWTRGQMLLEQDLEQCCGDPDRLLELQLDAVLDPEEPVVDFEARLPGQRAANRRLQAVTDQAWERELQGEERSPGRGIYVQGPREMGERWVANVLADSIGATFSPTAAHSLRSVADLERVIEPLVNEDVALVYVDQIADAPSEVIASLDEVAREGIAALDGLKGASSAALTIVGSGYPGDAPGSWDTIDLVAYERDTVANIVRSQGYGWHLEVRRFMALAGQLRPDLALKRSADLKQRTEGHAVTDRHVVAAMEDWGLDRLGLTRNHHHLLNEIGDAGSATVPHLASTIGHNEREVRWDLLGYLAELGLAKESSHGEWTLTNEGKEFCR